jgi:hypothetical protein
MPWLLWAGVLVALAIVASRAPLPDRNTDRGVYEATAQRGIVVDCNDLHCFRVLVPWVIGRLPGPSLTKWRAYAVAANATAALAVFQLCVTLGLSRRAACLSAVVSGFGFGSLYTVYDSFTSDPLMFLLGPLVTNELLDGRIGIAAAAGVAGVFAKEFAAAPLYGFAGAAALARRWGMALSALAAANLALIAWALLTLTLMVRFNYSWGGNESSNIGSGAALLPWLQRQSARGIASAMFNEFGALYVLAPVGFFLAPAALRRLALAALPIAAVFAYVEQPDRALWNFHYLVVPLAALVLERAPAALSWGTVITFAAGNLRVGAQLPIAPFGRIALVCSVMLAIGSSLAALRPRATARVASA